MGIAARGKDLTEVSIGATEVSKKGTLTSLPESES